MITTTVARCARLNCYLPSHIKREMIVKYLYADGERMITRTTFKSPNINIYVLLIVLHIFLTVLLGRIHLGFHAFYVCLISYILITCTFD